MKPYVLLPFALLLAACSTPPVNPDPAAPPALLTALPSGEIQLSQGVGEYVFANQEAAGKLLDLIGSRIVDNAYNRTLLTQTTVKSDLTFTFPAVDATKLSPLLERLGDVSTPPEYCSGTSVMSDANLRLMTDSEVEIDGDTISGHINLAVTTPDQPNRPLEIVYADRAGTLKTDVTCTVPAAEPYTFRVVYDLKLHQGWNLVEVIEPRQQVDPTAILRSVPMTNLVRLRPSGRSAVGGSWGSSAQSLKSESTVSKGLFF